MGSDLVISGGGQIAVAPDALFRHAIELDAIGDEFNGSAWQLSVTEGASTSVALLQRLHDDCAFTASSLRCAADAYGLAERANENLMRELSARVGYLAGFYLPLAALVLAPTVASFAPPLTLALGALVANRDTVVPLLGDWLTDHRGPLSDPFTLTVLRLAVSSGDEFGQGLLRIPPFLAPLLTEGGVAGMSSTVVAAAAAGGLLTETAVRTTPVAHSSTTPPTGIAERVKRIPSPAASNDHAQVRIDRISSAGEPDRFEVYIAGTVDFSVEPSGEPWDMTSNMRSMADQSSGSARAVRLAMEQAGVTSSTPVVFTGHSQGGIIAHELAASGDFETAGVITVGSPGGHGSLPSHVPVIEIEHTDDLVPALSGVRDDHGAVLVQRRAFASGDDAPAVALAAHRREAYLETAAMADSASDPRLRDAVAAIDSGRTGAATSTLFRGHRVGAQ